MASLIGRGAKHPHIMKRPGFLRRYSSRVAWSEGDQAYIATSVEFPLLSAVGEAPEEALHELRSAIEVAVEALIEDGEQLPEPLHVTEFSGQFRLRLGRTQHAELVARAEREGLSLNTYVTQLVSTALGESRADSRTAEQLRTLRDELRIRSQKTPLRRIRS